MVTALVQRSLFDAALTAPERPRWLPAEDLPGPDWHLGTDEFPHVQDKALIEEEKPDAN